MRKILDAFSEVVDTKRRWNPEWYSWLDDVEGTLTDLSTTVSNISFPSAIFINVKDAPYNAQGDDATDDMAAIQAAIDAAEAAGGGTVYFPTGIYQHTGLIIDQDCVSLLGSSGPIFPGSPSTGSRLKYMAGTGTHLTIDQCSHAQIRNLSFFGGVTPTADEVIKASGQNHLFDQVRLANCWNGMNLKNSTFSMLNFVWITPDSSADFGIKWNATTESDVLYMNMCLVRPENPGSTTVAGYYIGKNVASVVAKFCGADNCNYSWIFDDEGESRPIIATLYGCSAEASTSDGFRVEAVLGLDLTDCYCNINGARGIFLGSNAENVHVNGGQVNLNQDEGVYLSNGAFECHFNHLEAMDNGQSGFPGASNAFVEANTTNFSFMGGRYGGMGTSTLDSDNSWYGIEIVAGTSDWYRIIGVDVHGNAVGGLSDGGTGVNKVVANNLG